MAKEFSDWFYHTEAWQNTRAAFIRAKGGYCERCMKEFREGKRSLQDVQPIKIVHHKIYLTPDNIKDPEICLSFGNLEGLCEDHHNKEHKSKTKRYFFDKDGRPLPKE